MRAALVVIAPVIALLATARTARADEPLRLRHVEDAVWAMVAKCDQGDDVQQRQCRHARDQRRAELAGRTIITEAVVKSDTVLCLQCDRVDIAGQRWAVIAVGTAQQLTGLKPQDPVEVALQIGASPVRSEAGAPVFAFTVGAVRKLGVGAPLTGLTGDAPHADKPPLADQPNADDIRAAMAELADASRRCYDKLAVAGNAMVALHVLPTGAMGPFELTGALKGTPTGDCLEKALGKLAFPPSKRGINLHYPLKVGP